VTQRDQERMWQLAGRYSAVGIEMAIAVAMGTLGGYWLDKKLGTFPGFFIFGLFAGIGAAVLTVIRIVRTTKL
jgi:ATP synthase protein I